MATVNIIPLSYKVQRGWLHRPGGQDFDQKALSLASDKLNAVP